jgi:hypothetical protein
MTRHSYTGTQSTGDWLMGAVKSNPEGLLLLAAGCALLLRSGASKVSAQASGQRSASSVGGSQQYNQGNHGQRPAGSGISESISQAADSAREYAADVGKTVSDKAGAYASTVGEYADDAWRQSERLAGQASRTVQQTVSRVLQEQPLALAVAGLAAGAAVAAAFPSTAVERRTLGPAGERLSEAASSAGQQLSQAASKAGEKLMSAADERGLNTEGLKEVASDVAGAFTGAFGGDQTRGGQPSGSGSQGQSSPGSSAQPGGTSASSGQGGQSTRPGSSSTGTNYGQPSSGAPLPGGASKPGTTRQS